MRYTPSQTTLTYDVCVCNECIRLYSRLLEDYSLDVKPANKHSEQLLLPHEIKALLDKRVIGHDDAKIALSIAMYNHELLQTKRFVGKYLKNNILLVGSTGVGKTYMVECIADILDLPFVICDATTFSEVGYVGEDVSHIIELLYHNANCDITRTEFGIVFLDEIDKLGGSSSIFSYGRDVSGVGVQQALLKMMEGKNITLSSSDRAGKRVKINTRNILEAVFTEKFHFGRLVPAKVAQSAISEENRGLRVPDFCKIVKNRNFSRINRRKIPSKV